MKIVLIDPPLPPAADADISSYPNLGFMSLIAYARREVPEVPVDYLQGSYHLPGWMEAVLAAEPDVVGLSFATLMSQEAYAAAKALREKRPEVLLICGGPHPTVAPEEVLKDSEFDVCCVGEGEVTFAEFLRCLHERGAGPTPEALTALADIPGLRVRGSERFVPRAYLPNLDDLPMPAWDLIDFSRYEGSNYQKARPATCILVSRGCPYRCVFCSNPVWHAGKPLVRSRSPHLIVEEVETLYQRGVREIYIRSD